MVTKPGFSVHISDNCSSTEARMVALELENKVCLQNE